MKKKLPILFSVLALLLSVLACSLFQSGPGKVATNFIKATEAGEIEEALGYLSSSNLQVIGMDKWRALLTQMTQEISSKGGISSIKVLDETTTGSIATVSLRIKYGNETEETDSIDLIQENGEWKINVDPYSK